MKYILQGAHVTNVYEVVKHESEDGSVKHYKPSLGLSINGTQRRWEEISTFEADTFSQERIRLTSDGEDLYVERKFFVVDENAVYLHTNKVLSKVNDKETNAAEYQEALQEYYDYVLEEYPKVKEYLEVHEIRDPLENIDKIKDMVMGDSSDKESYYSIPPNIAHQKSWDLVGFK